MPEVETVRRTLARHLPGRRVVAVTVHRRDVVRGETTTLRGQRIERIERWGKQLALVGESLRNNPDSHPGRGGGVNSGGGGCVCVHLGMSGSLCLGRSGVGGGGKADSHVHVTWEFEDGMVLAFRDPRRFGGVWAFESERALLETRWRRLGPDGLLITPGQLYAGLSRTRRVLKAALLDQHLVAGLGNIYVDELLHAVKLHPRKLACGISKPDSVRLVRAMRRLLGRAIEAGGTTLRDYVDAEGRPGLFRGHHRVYGRGGEPCPRCRAVLETMVIAGRTTTACGRCQSV